MIDEHGISPKLGSFASTNKAELGSAAHGLRDVFTACYLASGHVVSGGPNGCITIWDGERAALQHGKRRYTAMAEHPAHAVATRASDAEFRNHNGAGWRGGGCTALRAHPEFDSELLSAGGDGVIRHWRCLFQPDRETRWVSGIILSFELLRSSSMPSQPGAPPRVITGVDWCAFNPAGGRDAELHSVAVDSSSDIWLIPESQAVAPTLEMVGASGAVNGVVTTCHPLNS